MKILNYDLNRLEIEKKIAWLLTVALMVAGLPILKNAVVFIFEKIYELFIQHAFVK